MDAYGKDWWIVETEGGSGPYGWNTGSPWPSVGVIAEIARYADSHDAKVIGFYRLWGTFGGAFSYDEAYNIYVNPGNNPTPTRDADGQLYWTNIRDL